MDGRLAGKVVVVTGASSGFGRGIAVKFARQGAKVVVGDLQAPTTPGNFDERPELTTAELIAAEGGEAVFHRCDVTRQAEVAELIAAASAHFGRLDILVNNAGVYRGGSVHLSTEADLDACYNVIVKGTWFGCQEAIKTFLAQGDGGTIVNICSSAAIRTYPNQSVYNMAKHAQGTLTKSVALEYGRQGIRANGVCPTYAKTAMSRRGFERDGAVQGIRSIVPMGRWAEIEDVADLALFLASDESKFITGSLIAVDGGEVLGHHASRFAPGENAPA